MYSIPDSENNKYLPYISKRSHLSLSLSLSLFLSRLSSSSRSPPLPLRPFHVRAKRLFGHNSLPRRNLFPVAPIAHYNANIFSIATRRLNQSIHNSRGCGAFGTRVRTRYYRGRY